MKNNTYQYSDYNINECIRAMNKWMKIQKEEINKGNLWVNSIHIEKEPSIDIYYPEKWSFIVNYSQK